MNPEQGHICKRCGSDRTAVIDVRSRYPCYEDRKIRRRKCLDCGSRWTTVELHWWDFVRLREAET